MGIVRPSGITSRMSAATSGIAFLNRRLGNATTSTTRSDRIFALMIVRLTPGRRHGRTIPERLLGMRPANFSHLRSIFFELEDDQTPYFIDF
jgi:hypothetical protein